MTENPYQAPESDVEKFNPLPESKFNHMAKGQKLIIYALIFYVVGTLGLAFSNQSSATGIPPAIGILLLALILAIIGIVRALIGIEAKIYTKILLVIAMFIPGLNLLALASLSQRVTTALRAAGYRVGFWGVKN